MSPEDYEFVCQYAIDDRGGINGRATETIYGSLPYNGNTYIIQGNCYLNGTGSYTWGGTIQTGSSTTTSGTKTVCLGIMAYQGMTVIANDTSTRSGGAGNNWFTGQPFGSFNGLCSYHTFTYYSIINTNDGNSITVR